VPATPRATASLIPRPAAAPNRNAVTRWKAVAKLAAFSTVRCHGAACSSATEFTAAARDTGVDLFAYDFHAASTRYTIMMHGIDARNVLFRAAMGFFV
jgi:hypothetical protein